VVAKLIQSLGFVDEKMLLERGLRIGANIYQHPSPEKKTRS
jgi:hypothetical protein